MAGPTQKPDCQDATINMEEWIVNWISRWTDLVRPDRLQGMLDSFNGCRHGVLSHDPVVPGEMITERLGPARGNGPAREKIVAAGNHRYRCSRSKRWTRLLSATDRSTVAAVARNFNSAQRRFATTIHDEFARRKTRISAPSRGVDIELVEVVSVMEAG